MAQHKIRLPSTPSRFLELLWRINSCWWSNPKWCAHSYSEEPTGRRTTATTLRAPRAEKCKLRGKDSVFWVNINRDIEEMVKSCAPCQRDQHMNLKEPLIPHDIPQKPCHTLGCRLFFWNNSSYLLLSDYYSKFPLVRKPNNIRSDTAIAHLRSIF